jgi:SNF2 family DNA or RNA helicase
MLVVHPASAGHGLNLQDPCWILCDFSSGWNLEYDEQVIERLGPTRQLQSGYDRVVFRYRIVARDTVEELSVLPRLKSKASVQDSLKLAMKVRK